MNRHESLFDDWATRELGFEPSQFDRGVSYVDGLAIPFSVIPDEQARRMMLDNQLITLIAGRVVLSDAIPKKPSIVNFRPDQYKSIESFVKSAARFNLHQLTLF